MNPQLAQSSMAFHPFSLVTGEYSKRELNFGKDALPGVLGPLASARRSFK